MKCSLCGRRLKNSKSMETGYGPVCYQKVFGRKYGKIISREEKDTLKSFQNYDVSGQMSIEDYLRSLT